MKKSLSFLLVFMLIISAVPLGTFTLTVSAATTYNSGVFTYTVTDNKATITKVDTITGDDVTIPSTLDDYTVTGIGVSAFYDCNKITSITIPNSITTIGESAFDGCTGLTSITVSSGNTNYSSIDGVLFNKDTTVLVQYPIGKTATSYTIPDSVTGIGMGAFYGCTSLTEINISSFVESIGDFAFSNTGITSINIPDNVTNMGNYTFNSCKSLTSIGIGSGVTSIGYNIFEGCKKLTDIIIPSGVTSVGNFAFRNCSALKDVWYPADEKARSQITIGGANSYLTNATWHYGYCANAEQKVHIYDDDFDATCNVCSAERIAKKRGDTNGDDSIDNKDCAIIMQHINNWNVEIDLVAAEVYIDGKINNKDYVLLMRQINGWGQEQDPSDDVGIQLPVDKW